MSKRLLGGISPAAFLKNYWQKRPLLVRGAFPDFVDPLSPDELAGLAVEADVTSRLILERGGKKPWEVTHGPIAAKRLRSLPKSHWTLLVSRVNEWVPEAALLLDQFSFIPGWRLDDLMVSFAPESGTVGPHIDSYDVFLIQGLGRRRWQIATTTDQELRAGLDLKMLKRFKSTKEWVLEPGDMLYLPPGVAHFGVALEPCMTYSVGFRAPSVHGLLLELLGVDGEALSRKFGERLYADPDLKPARAGEIDGQSLRRVRALADVALADPGLLSQWLGKYVTRPDQWDASPKRGRVPARLLDKLKRQTLWRRDAVRLAWADFGDKLSVYVGGEETLHAKSMRPLVQALCEARCHPPGSLLKKLPKGAASRRDALSLLGALAAHDAIYFLSKISH